MVLIYNQALLPKTILKRKARLKERQDQLTYQDEEVILEAEAKCDSCGGNSFCKIEEDVSEILERIPESYKVIKYISSRSAYTNCDSIVQAYTPSKVIDRGITGPGLLADILVNKFSNHLRTYL